MTPTERDIRQAVADYIASEGCSCCRNIEAHSAAAEWLGKLLAVPMYPDKSGRDFGRFRTPPRERPTWTPKGGAA